MNRRTVLAGLGLAPLALARRAGAQGGISFIDTHMHPLRGRGSVSGAVSGVLQALDRFGIELAILLPPPFPGDDRAVYGLRELASATRGEPRLAFAAGGESLNPVLQQTPFQRAEGTMRRFTDAAEEIAAAGAAAFGEIALEHFSSGRGQHPYESSPPDHPLLLALADIGARYGMPLELHMEAVPQDMPFPPNRPKGRNPDTLVADIAPFERLLAHNRQARMVWAHAGWDLTARRTPLLMEGLLRRHPNLFMNIKFDRAGARLTAPFAPNGELHPGWLAMLRNFSDRFMIGSDEFVSDGTEERLQNARRLVDALPPEIAPLVARENARRIYRLPAGASAPAARQVEGAADERSRNPSAPQQRLHRRGPE